MSAGLSVRVFQRGGSRRENHAQLVEACRIFLRMLLGPRYRVRVRIELRATVLDAQTSAEVHLLCNGAAPQRDFTVIIRRDSLLSEQLMALAHECVHIQQSVSRRLQYRRVKTDGQLHVWWEWAHVGLLDDLPYAERPWEIEAEAREQELVQVLSVRNTVITWGVVA